MTESTMTPHAFAIGASVTYKPNGGDVLYRATVVSHDGHNPFGDPMYSVRLLEAVPGVNVPERDGVKALVIPARAVGDVVTTHETPLALIDETPRPAGEPAYSKLFSTTEGFTLWDRAPGSLNSGPDRFRLYTPGGIYLGAYGNATDTERFAALLATEMNQMVTRSGYTPGAAEHELATRPAGPNALTELIEAATAAKDELAAAGRYAEPVCTRLEAALKVMPAAWSGEAEAPDNAAQLRALIESGLTFGEVLNVFGEHQREKMPELTPYSEAVDSVLPGEASFITDDTPLVSKGDDPGAYVMVWRWVTNEDAGVFTEIEIEHFDEDPDGDEDRAGDGFYYRKVGDEGWSGAWHSEDEARTEAENEYGPVKVKGDDDGVCPKGDPECLGDNGDCHDACVSPDAEPEK